MVKVPASSLNIRLGRRLVHLVAAAATNRAVAAIVRRIGQLIGVLFFPISLEELTRDRGAPGLSATVVGSGHGANLLPLNGEIEQQFGDSMLSGC